MKIRILSIGLVAFATLVASQPSLAQYGAAYQSFINTLITNKVWEGSLRNKSTNERQRSSGTPAPTTAPKQGTVSSYGDVIRNTAVTPEQVKRAVRFRSSGTRVALDEFVGSLNATDEEKAEMKVRLIELL